MVSAWFLVAEAYAIDPAALNAIRAVGGEIRLHGLHRAPSSSSGNRSG
jgi:hypothetical protein